jgi:hypothetical protein
MASITNSAALSEKIFNNFRFLNCRSGLGMQSLAWNEPQGAQGVSQGSQGFGWPFALFAHPSCLCVRKIFVAINHIRNIRKGLKEPYIPYMFYPFPKKHPVILKTASLAALRWKNICALLQSRYPPAP